MLDGVNGLWCVIRRRRFERDIYRRSWAINCDEVELPNALSSASQASSVASISTYSVDR